MSFYGGGGAGAGHAASGNAGSASGDGEPGGAAGGTTGNAGLTVMQMGAAGGTGGAGYQPGDNWRLGGVGGTGGGIVVLIGATITISSTGSIAAGGLQGANTEISHVYPGRSGGGAGGSVLLKGKEIDINTNKITVAAGAAGAAGGAAGGAGAVGRIHADYSVSFTGSCSPTIDTTEDATITEYAAGGSALLMFVG